MGKLSSMEIEGIRVLAKSVSSNIGSKNCSKSYFFISSSSVERVTLGTSPLWRIFFKIDTKKSISSLACSFNLRLSFNTDTHFGITSYNSVYDKRLGIIV